MVANLTANKEAVTDEVLMLAYAQGDNQAFSQLYNRHKGGLYRYFVRQIHDLQLAEDLYQDTWGRVIKSASSYQASAKFTTWLYRIAHNLVIDHVRSVKPVDNFTDVVDDEQSFDVNDESMAPEPSVIMQAKARLLEKCISLLPQVQKEALIMNFEMGFTAITISEIANVSMEATKSRLRYAQQSLKQCVANKWQEVGHG
ncbi:sigma-70 family RNA polymerase sigma factor [Shewanella marina]|uniref:sigma-70 family RNA polymerase sigma factor n=1 Tax=Shewanella marina TaxID=487319 RepID=UPI00046F077D|nr:sigma-70 family RNA polymerase sigma factor [Shewanella marina]